MLDKFKKLYHFVCIAPVKLFVISFLVWFVVCTLDIAVQWNLSHTTLGGWYTIVVRGGGTAFLFLSVLFFLGRYARWIYVPLVIWMGIVLVIEWFVRINFNMSVLGDIWLFLVGSSNDEARAFVSQFLTIKLILCVSLACGMICLFVKFFLGISRLRVTRWSFLCGIGCCALACGMFSRSPLKLSTYERIVDGLASKAIVSDSIERGAEWKNLAEICKRSVDSSNWVSHILPGKEPLGVVIIGESVSRNHMQLYGYERPTTPTICSLQDELVVFTNLIGSASHTQRALKDFFTDFSLDKGGLITYTFPQVLQSYGYGGGVVSAQGHWGSGYSDSCFATIFDKFETKIYIDEVTNVWPKYDSMLLPYVERSIRDASPNKPTAIFFHTHGSHFPFQGCPPEFAQWTFSDKDAATAKINSYDNTIYYTDLVISNVVSYVERTQRASFVVYFSDHGESPRSKLVRDQDDMDVWEIPLFIWFSPEYRQAYPETIERLKRAVGKALQSDQLLIGLLEVFQIANRRDELSFLSDKFEIRYPRYIQRGKKRYDKD